MMNALHRSMFTAKPTGFARLISTSYTNFNNGYGGIIDPPGHEPFIPKYTKREGENAPLKRARLTYQSRKRGMLENGLLLSTFAKKYLTTFDDRQLAMYDELINQPSNDWDIFYWATGVKPTPPEYNNEIMDLLKKHIKNEDRQARIMQPEL